MNNPTGPTGDPARISDATATSQGASTSPLTGSPGYVPPEAPPPGASYTFPPTPPSAPYQATYPPQPYPPTAFPPQATDRHRHRTAPIVGPVILIGAGAVFLLNSLDILPWSIWNQVWRLWPLVLIAIGLDLLIGRRNPLLSLLLVLLVVGSGILFLAYGGFRSAGGLVSTPLNIPLAGAKSAIVTLELGTGNLSLDGGTTDQGLATGTLEYYENRGAPEQSVSTAGDKAVLTLRQVQGNNFDIGSWFSPNRGPEWNVHLNPSIPISINADLGTGNSTLDFSQLKVTDIGINSGTGNSTLVFPANAGHVTGKVEGGVGNLSLKIPDSLQARLDVSSGIGNINVDSRFTKQGDNIYISSGYADAPNKLDLKLDVGVGNVEISP